MTRTDDAAGPGGPAAPDPGLPLTRPGEWIASVNGADLCLETFGDAADPAILLVGTSMLSWEDDLCRRLAAGSRHVIRYDIRDTGRSAGYPPGSPRYTLRDLVADAVGLLDLLGVETAHVAGFSAGGWIAQLLALDHPHRVATLTLLSTRPIAPGVCDPDLPDHSPEIMDHFVNAPEPDWSDRAAVLDHLVRTDRVFAGSLPFDEPARRAHAARVLDRTGDILSALRNIAFIDHGDRWRERLGEITTPTLVIHGTEDPFFPHGNGAALADEIPGARLLSLDRTGHELPRAVWDVVVPALLRHTSRD